MRKELWRPVCIAALLSLAITLLRFCGELAGLDARFFSRDPGGGSAIVGIGWLAPFCGLWFAVRLCGAGAGAVPARPFSALGTVAVGYGFVAAAVLLIDLFFGVTFAGMATGAAGALLGAAVAFRAWPELGVGLLVYAALARVPILVLTVVEVAFGFGTHYGKLAAGAAELAPLPRTLVLCAAQLVFWIPFTLLLGMLAGVLAAIALRRARPRTGPDDRPLPEGGA